MSNRIIDGPAIEKLSALAHLIKDSDMAISMDFLGNKKIWIVQLFDSQERLVISGSSDDLSIAIRKVYENWFAKTGPKI